MFFVKAQPTPVDISAREKMEKSINPAFPLFPSSANQLKGSGKNLQIHTTYFFQTVNLFKRTWPKKIIFLCY